MRRISRRSLSTAGARCFDENNPSLAKCIRICLLGHVFTCFPVGVACGVVAVVRAMWLVQCAASAQARCHMYAANNGHALVVFSVMDVSFSAMRRISRRSSCQTHVNTHVIRMSYTCLAHVMHI